MSSGECEGERMSRIEKKREPVVVNTLSQYYRFFRADEERISNWRKGMYDKVREDARRKIVASRTRFKADELEAWLRSSTLEELNNRFVGVEVVQYVIHNKGISIQFVHSASSQTEVAKFNWEDIDAIEQKQNQGT